MSFIEEIKQRAKKEKKTIVLPEAEDIRVLKETKNNINRKVNCETANLKKTVSAAVSQIQAIEKLKKERRFKSLPENLREIAEVRIENPDATIAELGKMLSVPIR